MENEKIIKKCSFCNRERNNTALMCYGVNEDIAICNFCIAACLKAVGQNILDNFKIKNADKPKEL
jgi:hypothetical protein